MPLTSIPIPTNMHTDTQTHVHRHIHINMHKYTHAQRYTHTPLALPTHTPKCTNILTLQRFIKRQELWTMWFTQKLLSTLKKKVPQLCTPKLSGWPFV